jgi:hypothetical protein
MRWSKEAMPNMESAEQRSSRYASDEHEKKGKSQLPL